MQVSGNTETNFKETEIGLIPADWDILAIGEVMSVVYRYPSYYGIEYVEKGVPEVRGELLMVKGKRSCMNGCFGRGASRSAPTEIIRIRIRFSIRDDGEIDEALMRYISRDTANHFPKTELQESDLVMSVRGTMGKIGIVRSNLAGANITANLMRLSPNPAYANSEYLKHLLLSDAFLRLLDSLSPQTTIKTIQASVLKSIPLPLPPLPEQRRIAAALKAIQDEIAAQDNIITEAREFKRSLMQRLFTYGVGAEPAETKETEIGEIPAHWDVVTLNDIARIERGKFAHRPRNDPAYYGGSVPFIQTGDVSKANGRITTYS